MRRFSRPALAALFVFVGITARGDLAAYFAKPEPAYKWEKRGEMHVQDVTVTDIHLVSQTWQGMNWEHRLLLFRPDKCANPEFCGLYNTGGNGNPAGDPMGIRMAKSTGALYAILYNIPNQPLYGGKTEDALVVHTWLKFMETGDESWPLHFPMAKACLKAMDAIQESVKQDGKPAVTGFLIHGGSKRGWTTWLAGASRDPRIKAIAPMVIDTLNLPEQAKYQATYYAKTNGSEQIGDYSQVDMFHKLQTPQGRRLIQLEDPYSYRDILTLPKLILLGTNDPYWPQDALNLYWNGLKGPKWVLYAPNSGHGLNDRDRVLGTLAAFTRMIANHRRWPKMRWSYKKTPTGVELTFISDIKAKEGRLFHVHGDSHDLRREKWTFDSIPGSNGVFTASFDTPSSGVSAIYGEAVYDLDGTTFTLSTQIHLLLAPGYTIGGESSGK